MSITCIRPFLVLLVCAFALAVDHTVNETNTIDASTQGACNIQPIANATTFRGDYPAPEDNRENWKPARGYSWTVSCWTQASSDLETGGPAPVLGGTSAHCPPGLMMEIESPIIYLEKDEQFTVRFSFISNQTQFTADSALGWGYALPHIAAYGCMASDCLYCIPAVDIQPDSPTHVGTRVCVYIHYHDC